MIVMLSRQYEIENFSEVLAKDQYSWGLQRGEGMGKKPECTARGSGLSL